MKEKTMHALPPELQQLVDIGLMSRDEAIEAHTFMDALADAVQRGEITAAQAGNLGAMLGLADTSRAVARAS